MSASKNFRRTLKEGVIDFTDPCDNDNNAAEKKTPWDLYNERAQIYDRETIKEWEDTLSIHLVFAALFSGILTAFIIASLPILQEDNQEVMKDILINISKQLNNATISSYESTVFRPPSWAIRVNILFFTSLGCNLFAAFASVLALQWVREYDMGLSGITEPRERALRRQLRLEGMKHWLMPEIISMLIPTLLHVALLFFVGALLDWLIQIHIGIAYTMVVTLVITTLFYIGTQFISSISPSAPYKTPLSRKLELVWGSMKKILDSNPCEGYPEQKRALPGIRRLADHHLSELEAVRSSQLLPSSALFWALNHIDHSDRHVQMLLDICLHLFQSEQASTLAQTHSRHLVHWSTIIDNVAQYLGTMRQDNDTYSSHINERFLILFCALAIFGGNSIELAPSTWLILTRAPFSQSVLQSTPLGLTCRFALWRQGRGFPVDISGPPVDLFHEIFLQYKHVPNLIIIIVLREVRVLFDTGLLTSKDTMECLKHLLNSDDSINGIIHLFQNENVAAEVLATMSTLFKLPLRETTKVELVKHISNILDACSSEGNTKIKKRDRLNDLVYLLLPQILYDLTQNQDDRSVVEKLELLRHPTLSSVWMDETIKSRFDRTASIRNDCFWQEARELYPMRDTKTHVFLVELAHSLLILLSHLPKPLVAGNETWYMMSSCLITLGCCISGNRYDERLVRWAPDHDPASWIAQVLASLKPGMSDPTLAFLISALLMGHVRRLYGRNLHCTASTESRSQLREVGDPLLSLIGCLLLGWEYGDFIPLQDDPVWETAAMMVAMDFKNGFGPYMLYRSDADLLLTIASHTNEWVQDRGLWFLTKYSDVSFFANQSDSHARKATTKELLEMALPLFINHPIRQCYQVNLVIKWSFRDRFFGPFLDLGGLVWLSGLMLPWPEECSSCIRFTSPLDGITMLLRHRIQLQELTMEELPEAQAKMLLQSPFLRDTFPDSDAHKYIFMVTTVFEHLKRFGCVDLCFSDVAVKLEEIIGWDEAQRQHCWERSCHELGLIGEGSMQEWMGDLNVLVERLLRGDTEQFRPSRFHYDLTPQKGKLDLLNAQRGKDRLRFHWCSIPHFGRPVVPPPTNSRKHILAAQEYE